MAAKIKHIVLPSPKEVIAQKIATILAEELANQNTLGSSIGSVSVFRQRYYPVNHTEMPVVNVTIENAEYSSQSAGQRNANYPFQIDVYTTAQSSDEYPGPTNSIDQNNYLCAVITAILEDSQYKTLGFDTTLITNRTVRQLQNVAPNKDDSHNVAISRIFFDVKVVETTQLLEALNAQVHITNIKIESTNKGYKYVYLGSNLSISVSNVQINLTPNDEVTFDLSTSGISSTSKLVLLVSNDEGITFVESVAIGQLSIAPTITVTASDIGPTSANYIIKLKSVENPDLESLPVSIIFVP